jgi:hypothetical protein
MHMKFLLERKRVLRSSVHRQVGDMEICIKK